MSINAYARKVAELLSQDSSNEDFAFAHNAIHALQNLILDCRV